MAKGLKRAYGIVGNKFYSFSDLDDFFAADGLVSLCKEKSSRDK
jgi:hypothetical protein